MSEDSRTEAIAVAPAKITPPAPPALRRERILSQLDTAVSRRLTLVVAPAGYGKSTAIADFASSRGVLTAWYRVEALDSDEARLITHLQRALRRVIPALDTDATSVSGFAEAVERALEARVLLVVDDAHTIAGTPAEETLERIVACAPDRLAIIVSGRAVPTFNLARLRVEGCVTELYADDLRFRQWEVEELFHYCYGQRLQTDELAELTRKTGGWAAGLQLFHLATRDGTQQDRRAVLLGLSTHSHLVREFLTRNVLDHLSDDLRAFLLETSLLGRLSGDLCDRFLARTGSHEVLVELQRRRLFVQHLDSDTTYRYHEALRSHMEAMLTESVGETVVREMSGRAGRLLEGTGALTDALRAYSRAEDGDAVERLTRSYGSQLASEPGHWIEGLPSTLLANDAWLLLALARRQLASGRPQRALDSYRHAERALRGSAVSEQIRDERLTVQAWLDPTSAQVRVDHWWRLLRLLGCDTARPFDAHTDAACVDVASAVRALVAGKVTTARRAAIQAQRSHDAPISVQLLARLIEGVAAALMRDGSGSATLHAAEERAERVGAGWLARLARAASSIDAVADAPDSAEVVQTMCENDGDAWGAAIASLLQGIGALYRGRAQVEPLYAAETRFARLGAAVPAAWASSFKALAAAQRGDVSARQQSVRAEKAARRRGVPAASAFAYVAQALLDNANRPSLLALAEDAVAGTGLVLPPDPFEQPDPATTPHWHDRTPLLAFNVFGGLRVQVDGEPTDVSLVKPRARSLLRLLAVHAGDPVHREVICESLWPDATGDTAIRCLQVAVSSLRQTLERAVGGGRAAVLIRDGAAYRLPADERCGYDMRDFRLTLDAIRDAATADPDAAASSFLSAANRFGGQLLPEEGPAEWVDELRERCDSLLMATAEHVARAGLASGRFELVATVCRRALDHDRYRDELWRLLLASLESAGDAAAGAREAVRYRAILAELGVSGAGAP